MTIVNVEHGHALHDGHDGLEGVAVDDDDELHTLLKGITIFVDNPVEQRKT